MMNSIWFVSVIASMVMAVIITSIGTAPFLYLMAIAYGQQANTNGNSPVVGPTVPKKPLPVLLIHGYLSDASIWNNWQDLLKKDSIPAYPITFQQSSINVDPL